MVQVLIIIFAAAMTGLLMELLDYWVSKKSKTKSWSFLVGWAVYAAMTAASVVVSLASESMFG